MGQAKFKQRAAFAPQLIEEWEAEDCINFAVALTRLTGWLLHVDWWSTSMEHKENIPVDELKPLRAYVADNHERVFDARGIRSIAEFNDRTIRPLAHKMRTGNGGVYTRFYAEEKLPSLPLRKQPDEVKIARATEAIRSNPYFLEAIPPRKPPYLPAHEAAKFTYGRCAAYAEAMLELTGLPPVALLARRFTRFFEGTRRSESGYFHSVVLRPEGMAEDSWGTASLEEIAGRFGVVEFDASAEEHRLVVETIRRTSNDRYELALKDAKRLIQAHRL